MYVVPAPDTCLRFDVTCCAILLLLSILFWNIQEYSNLDMKSSKFNRQVATLPLYYGFKNLILATLC
jgi:hypothetical protein